MPFVETVSIAFKFTFWSFLVVVLFRIFAESYYRKNHRVMGAAKLGYAVGVLSWYLLGSLFCVLAVSRLLQCQREEYGSLIWIPRIAAAVFAGGSVYILWLAFNPRKRKKKR